MKHHLHILAFCVISVCSGCIAPQTNSFSLSTLNVEEADKSEVSILQDSIYIACWYLPDSETRVVFGSEFCMQNIYPYLFSFTNTSSFPVCFYSDSIPRYIPLEQTKYKVPNQSGSAIAAGFLGGLTLPFVLTTEKTDDAGNTTSESILPIKPETFLITGALGLIIGIGMESTNAKENSKVTDKLREVTKPTLVIPPGFNGYTVVFTKHELESDSIAVDTIKVLHRYIPGVPDSLPVVLKTTNGADIHCNVPVTR
ncbi:MAG: hypothetical protein JNJ85_13130 [Candidatus Kapabacteria bacterium]|nr:hypothetical protein [Candidatus Kapabacteria bacterium]